MGKTLVGAYPALLAHFAETRRKMTNRDTRIARKYHHATKHSPVSIRQDPHYLDWSNQPAPFKIYPGLNPIPLPADLPNTAVPALEAVKNSVVTRDELIIPDLRQIAYLLYYSAGITKKLVYPRQTIYFRAAACAGALYPIEMYLVCAALPGLEAGVYHFSPADFALRRLRGGDYRGFLSRTCGDEPGIQKAPAVLVYTAITWRSSWKYRARSYRYHFWDAGTMLANTLAACAALGLPASVVMGFVDQDLNHLLGIDGRREKSLALLPVGWADAVQDPMEEVPELKLEVEPLSAQWREYPLIDELHQASMLVDAQTVNQWRNVDFRSKSSPPRGGQYHLIPLDASAYPPRSLEAIILKRGSARRFEREPITFGELSTILEQATSGFPSDWRTPQSSLFNDLYINVHAVDGLPPGSYRYRPGEDHLDLIQSGDFRQPSAYLCLDQPLGGTSSATLFYIADLETILERYGNRGYRLVQLEAGITGGKLYLSAYALGRGVTGLTFFDDEVTRFFLPEYAREEAIFVTALGVPASPLGNRGKLIRMSPGDRVGRREQS
jgi:SagB-type dehydrogenase family enzyme